MTKLAASAAAILAALTASAITATKEYVDRRDGENAVAATNLVTSATNALAQAATATNALQDTAIESNRVDIASNRVAISTLSDTKLDKSGGTMTGWIRFVALGSGGYLDLAYDGENHRLVITDGWNENIAYLEVPNASSGDRVAFTHDIPDVPAWALEAQKPTYTAAEVGATSPAAVSNIVSTVYVRKKLGAWMEYDEATGLYYYCHEEE